MRSFIPLIVLVLCLLGCPSEPGTTPDSSPGDGSGTKSASEMTGDPSLTGPGNFPPSIASDEIRGAFTGRWVLFVHFNQIRQPALLLDLTPGEQPVIAAKSEVAKDWTVQESEVTETSARLAFENATGPVVIEVDLVDAIARGSATYGLSALDFVELRPTAAENLDDAKPEPVLEATPLVELSQKGEQVSPEELIEVVKQLDTSPIKVDMLQRWVQELSMAQADPTKHTEAAEKLVEAARPWGKRHLVKMTTVATMALAANESVPAQTIREWVNLSRETIDGPPNPATKQLLEFAEASAAVRDPDTELETTQELIAKVAEQSPIEILSLELRGQLAERLGNQEEALEVLAKKAILPWGQSIEPLLKEKYVKVRGSEDGYDAFVDQTYNESLTSFVTELPDDTGKTPVLVELFTGGSCPPCVAADVAIEGAEQTYGDELIVLRYHCDLPAPDPLSTADGHARFQAYQAPGTPTTIVNGLTRNVPGMSGPYMASPVGYENLKLLLSVLTKDDARSTVSVKATRDSEFVRATADVSGVPEEGDYNVVVALAAKELFLPMPNGIRTHSMVVRAMLGGPTGISLDDAATRTEGDGDDAVEVTMLTVQTGVEDLAGELMGNLRVGEETAAQAEDVITNFDDLAVVAFVQNIVTGEIVGVGKADVITVEKLPEVQLTTQTAEIESEEEQNPTSSPEPTTDASSAASSSTTPDESKSEMPSENTEAAAPSAESPSEVSEETESAPAAAESE